MDDDKIEVGDLNRFGFRIGSHCSEDAQFRDVSVLIAGCDVTRDHQAWAATFARGIRHEAERLKNTINFERYVPLFREFNLSELHSILLRREYPAWGAEQEWDCAAEFHRFMNLCMAETDGFASFLLPSARGLHLTYQLWDEKLQAYERLDVVDGTQRTVLPYDLIRTMEEAAAILERGVAEHLSEE